MYIHVFIHFTDKQAKRADFDLNTYMQKNIDTLLSKHEHFSSYRSKVKANMLVIADILINSELDCYLHGHTNHTQNNNQTF